MTLPLEGIKVIDFTGVQAGPVCTQLLAWFGADVLKIERVGKGDVTRRQFRDIPNVDALYFTMLNCNKRSLELNTKTLEGKEIMEDIIRDSDILVETFAPGSMERMGLTWEYLHDLNPRLIYGSVKGFGENSRYADLKVYENVAQCAGGAVSRTELYGSPLVNGSSLGDTNTGMHLAIGILAALRMRDQTGKGQKVFCSMQDAVLDLYRMKLHGPQNLTYQEEQLYPNEIWGDFLLRGGKFQGSSHPGWLLKCKGWENDPNAYIYMMIQEHNWMRTAQAIGKPEWIQNPEYNTAEARETKIIDIFKYIEDTILIDKTKDEAVDYLRAFDIPVSAVKSMKEIAYDPDLRATGSIVEVSHKIRGKYLTVGSPIKFSAFNPDIKESPLLGEHTNEVLTHLGYSPEKISELHKKKVIGQTGIM